MLGSHKNITRRAFLRDGSLVVGGLAVGSSALGAASCRCGADEGTDGGDASAQATPASWRDSDVRLDLRSHMHLADVDHHGLYVDFGTAARFKYTLGNWRSGWGVDAEEQGSTFTWVANNPARMYFHLDEPSPLRVVFRVRPGDSSRFSVYLNENPITRVDMPGGWTEQTVTIEASKAQAGENYLKLLATGPGDAGRAFAVDYVRIVPGEESPVQGGGFEAPVAATLSRDVTIAEDERPCLVLTAPTQLSYFLEIPENASLGFGLGLAEGTAATARVKVTDATTGQSERVHRAELSAGQWQDEIVTLGPFGGKVARLDFVVESQSGDAQVAWSTPSVLTPRATIRAADDASTARNVVVLLIDTLRADRLSPYARTRVQGPQMDRFSREGAVFERCQAPANWTKPSCASLLTGLHPPTHGALTEAGALSSSVRMCPEIFQQAGFQTSAFIANGYLAAEFGFNQGWNHYKNHIRERVPTEAEHVFGDALSWIREHRSQRTFTYIQTIDPHVPYDPPEEDLRLYDPAAYEGPISPRSTGQLLEDFKRERVRLSQRDRNHLVALYDGEVTYHDRHFGAFLDQLRELNLLDDTLVIITSDHGEEFFEHESVGHGHSVYQELLHVPLIMRKPGLVPAGQRFPQVCGLTDVVPTILDAAGVSVPDAVEGRSLVPELRGAQPPLLAAGFSSQWDTGNAHELAWTARIGDWKLRMRGPANSYLYDLARDPDEQNDVDSAHPIALRAARIALGQFLGAASKKAWTSSSLERPGAAHEAEQADMTPEMCEQLRALGYLNVENCQ